MKHRIERKCDVYSSCVRSRSSQKSVDRFFRLFISRQLRYKRALRASQTYSLCYHLFYDYIVNDLSLVLTTCI